MKNIFNRRAFSSIHIIGNRPKLRTRTLMGKEFKVSEQPMSAESCKDGLAKTYYYLKE